MKTTFHISNQIHFNKIEIKYLIFHLNCFCNIYFMYVITKSVWLINIKTLKFNVICWTKSRSPNIILEIKNQDQLFKYYIISRLYIGSIWILWFFPNIYDKDVMYMYVIQKKYKLITHLFWFHIRFWMHVFYDLQNSSSSNFNH